MKSLRKRFEDLFRPLERVETIAIPAELMTIDKIEKIIETKTSKRIAAALERIADALEKQNADKKPKMKTSDRLILENRANARAYPNIYPKLNVDQMNPYTITGDINKIGEILDLKIQDSKQNFRGE